MTATEDPKSPMMPVPDRVAAIVGVIVAVIAALVSLGWLPGDHPLASVPPDTLLLVVGTIMAIGATLRGRHEAAKAP